MSSACSANSNNSQNQQHGRCSGPLCKRHPLSGFFDKGTSIMIKSAHWAILLGLVAVIPTQLALSLYPSGQQKPAVETNATSVTDRQIAVMMFVDYGRGYGYQSMLAQIQVDTIQAELERDRQIYKDLEKLLRTNAISLSEFEIAQLKVVWGEKQLVVAQKNLIAISAQLEAMKKMSQHFAGIEISQEELYAVFRKGWDAGCDKGPDELAAMKAWVDYARKTLDRARELNVQGGESLSSLLEKEAQFKIAQANYQQRAARLDRCREILFPSLEDIQSIERDRE